MPSDPVSVLRDIEHQIDLAFQFVAGFDSAAFQNDTRTVYAVNAVPGNPFPKHRAVSRMN